MVTVTKVKTSVPADLITARGPKSRENDPVANVLLPHHLLQAGKQVSPVFRVFHERIRVTAEVLPALFVNRYARKVIFGPGGMFSAQNG